MDLKMYEQIVEIESEISKLKEVLYDYEYAIRMTRTFYNNCDTPLIKNQRMESIIGYREKADEHIKKIEELEDKVRQIEKNNA